MHARPVPIGLSRRWLLAGLILIILAVVFKQWLGPWAEQLPTDYSSVTNMSETNRFRNTANANWQANSLNVKRVDQTITSSSSYNLVEGSVHAYFDSGDMNFEASGLYGVDRATRANLPGYGDSQRSGQYLFPPHVKPGEYTIWDPFFLGPRQAAYARTEVVGGLAVYVFELTASGLDETAGYAFLAEVPERYQAHTDVLGTAWVEPISGQTLDYEDRSVSYFVEPATGARLADFNQFSEKFTPETKSAQLKIAREARFKDLALETWLPVVFLACGLACLVRAGFWLTRRKTGRALPGDPA